MMKSLLSSTTTPHCRAATAECFYFSIFYTDEKSSRPAFYFNGFTNEMQELRKPLLWAIDSLNLKKQAETLLFDAVRNNLSSSFQLQEKVPNTLLTIKHHIIFLFQTGYVFKEHLYASTHLHHIRS